MDLALKSTMDRVHLHNPGGTTLNVPSIRMYFTRDRHLTFSLLHKMMMSSFNTESVLCGSIGTNMFLKRSTAITSYDLKCLFFTTLMKRFTDDILDLIFTFPPLRCISSNISPYNIVELSAQPVAELSKLWRTLFIDCVGCACVGWLCFEQILDSIHSLSSQ